MYNVECIMYKMKSCLLRAVFLYLVFYRRHMKYVGKARVISVKKFCEERSGVEILAKNAALAPVSSSWRDFLW